MTTDFWRFWVLFQFDHYLNKLRSSVVAKQPTAYLSDLYAHGGDTLGHAGTWWSEEGEKPSHANVHQSPSPAFSEIYFIRKWKLSGNIMSFPPDIGFFFFDIFCEVMTFLTILAKICLTVFCDGDDKNQSRAIHLLKCGLASQTLATSQEPLTKVQEPIGKLQGQE
ncbi:hypothetical protein L218DRAFT_940301 [Marasmius fiardii PR-910]|nr:hypothetical protein L218DRAFT_940301 [Marasmius fiardii PR-910]